MPETRTRGEMRLVPSVGGLLLQDKNGGNIVRFPSGAKGDAEHFLACRNAVELHAGGDPENVGKMRDALRNAVDTLAAWRTSYKPLPGMGVLDERNIREWQALLTLIDKERT